MPDAIVSVQRAFAEVIASTIGSTPDYVWVGFDENRGHVRACRCFGIVKAVTDATKEMSLVEARTYDPAFELGDEIMMPYEVDAATVDAALTRFVAHLPVVKPPRTVEDVFADWVPEVRDGAVRILKVARRPGIMSKVVIANGDPSLDHVNALAACCGRGLERYHYMRRELGESLDIIAHGAQDLPNLDDPRGVIEFVATSLGDRYMEHHLQALWLESPGIVVSLRSCDATWIGLHAELTSDLLGIPIEIR